MTDESRVMGRLIEAGWSPGRVVPIAKAKAALASDGYSMWDDLLAFLTEFSGLTVRFTRHGREDMVWIDAERAVAWADRASVKAYETRFGVKLAPVGYAHHDHLLLLAADNGRFLGTYDDFISDLGTSPTALFDQLLDGESGPIETT